MPPGRTRGHVVHPGEGPAPQRGDERSQGAQLRGGAGRRPRVSHMSHRGGPQCGPEPGRAEGRAHTSRVPRSLERGDLGQTEPGLGGWRGDPQVQMGQPLPLPGRVAWQPTGADGRPSLAHSTWCNGTGTLSHAQRPSRGPVHGPCHVIRRDSYGSRHLPSLPMWGGPSALKCKASKPSAGTRVPAPFPPVWP